MIHAPDTAVRAHDAHDRLLVIQLATGDVPPAERARAERLVADCPACAELAADVVAIARAMSTSLPAARRTRDFRLSPEQAHELHRSRLSSWLSRVAWPRLGQLQPVAGAAVAVGLVMAVVTSPGFLASAPTSGGLSAQDQSAAAPPASGAERAGGAGAALPQPVPNAATAAPAGVPVPTPVTVLQIEAAPATAAPKGPAESAPPAFAAQTPAPTQAPAPLAAAPVAGTAAPSVAPVAAAAPGASPAEAFAAGSTASTAPGRVPAALSGGHAAPGPGISAQLAWLLVALAGALLFLAGRLATRQQRRL